MVDRAALAATVLRRCDELAAFSEVPGQLTRRSFSPPMHDVHNTIAQWMRAAGMTVRRDSVGNLIGRYPARQPDAPVLVIGSHLDTVPNAGRYDGVLGVMLGLALVEALGGRRLSYALEVVGFMDEEGVRFAVPFIGSRGYVGALPSDWLTRSDVDGITLREAITSFGLHAHNAGGQAALPDRALGYLEFHIEQGPVLERAGLPVGVVEAIAGATRAQVTFHGRAAHAGTTPMTARHDALAGAAAFILAVERRAQVTPGLVATVGQVTVLPGASNVVPEATHLALDVRHADDGVRNDALVALQADAEEIARSRGLRVTWTIVADVPAVRLDPQFVALLEAATREVGVPVRRLVSGAGHDAMILAQYLPAAMLFLRCAEGISHHPDERVIVDDVATALHVGQVMLDLLDQRLTAAQAQG
ncbi:MAG: allantoate amidohydrolase [Thermorudis peleae]|nr:allantoate amidohydrolase [Thermorudis peleae]